MSNPMDEPKSYDYSEFRAKMAAIREQRRYEIAKALYGAAIKASEGNVDDAARDSVRAADTLLAELDKP
jgi:hypothetical protein